MTPTTRRTLAVALVVALVLFFTPWLLRMSGAQGVIDPCVVWWTPQGGLVEICHKTYLPNVIHCGECLSAWPIMPDATATPEAVR